MITFTFFIVLAACLGVGVSGYYMFGSTVLDQITLSLERSSHAGAAMKALTWLMILTGEFKFQFFLICRDYLTLSLTLILFQPSPRPP